MEMKQLVQYHFKIEVKMKKKFLLLAEERGISLSALINSILEESFQVLEYFDLKFQKKRNFSSKKSQKEKISEDVWCYITPACKNKLFAIQHHYSLQSKAKVLRLVLKRYLKHLEEKGKKFVVKLIKCFQRKLEKLKEEKKVLKQFMPHKCKFSPKTIEGYGENYELLYLEVF